MPGLDIPTRWNSTHDMLQSCLRIEHSLTRMSEDLSKSKVSEGGIKPMVTEDWEKLEIMVEFLEPFNHCK